MKTSKGLISIHESKYLSSDEYHSIKSSDNNNYQILVEVENEVGIPFYSLGVYPEVYQTYEFQDVSYQRINDFNIDGFEYDAEKKVVFYGWIYGIYVVKDKNSYYDVITGTELQSAEQFYSNYKVVLTAELVGNTSSKANDHIIYTNAKLDPSFID